MEKIPGHNEEPGPGHEKTVATRYNNTHISRIKLIFFTIHKEIMCSNHNRTKIVDSLQTNHMASLQSTLLLKEI